MPKLRRLFSAALILLLIALASPVVHGQDTSVAPGINDSYQDPDVKQRVEQFEGEKREVSQQREAILKVCKLKPGMDVADIGAGTGLFTRPFAEKVGAQGTVYAVDITEKFLEHIQKTCKEQELKNVTSVLCTADDTKLEPNSIDLAFICDTYHHFEFPFKTMATVHKALRRDGRLIVIDFKKIEGVTSPRMMKHVRGDQKLTTEELTKVGFELVDTPDIMKGQYVLRMKKSR